MTIKRQEETDYDNPRERFTWAFRGISYNGFPLAAPEKVFADWSEHLTKCGFVHVDQLRELGIEVPFYQEIHYQPPMRGQDHDLNAAGEWIPVTQPVQDALVPMADQMTPQEVELMISQFKERGYID